MKNSIKVKCVESFTEYRNNKEKTLLAEVEEKEYTAKLYDKTEEYFAKDSKGREFLVGEIDIDGNLIIEDGFELNN